MNNKITVIYQRVGESPWTVEIDHTLERMQELVGGLIQRVSLPGGINLICNEEYELLGLPFNLDVMGYEICGNFFLCRDDDEGSFTSAVPEDMQFLRTIIEKNTRPVINGAPANGRCECCGDLPDFCLTKLWLPLTPALSEADAKAFREQHGDAVADVQEQMESTFDHHWVCENCRDQRVQPA
jgi:hypothetical protein